MRNLILFHVQEEKINNKKKVVCFIEEEDEVQVQISSTSLLSLSLSLLIDGETLDMERY